jgi:hypothetical protein
MSHFVQKKKAARKILMAELYWKRSVYSGTSLLADLKFQKFSGQYKNSLKWHQHIVNNWLIYSVQKLRKGVPDSEYLFQFKREWK